MHLGHLFTQQQWFEGLKKQKVQIFGNDTTLLSVCKKIQKRKGKTFQFLVHCCHVNLPLSIRVRIANFLLGFMSSQCPPLPIRLDGLSGPNSGPSSSVGPVKPTGC